MDTDHKQHKTDKASSPAFTNENHPAFCFKTCRTFSEIACYVKLCKDNLNAPGRQGRTDIPLVPQPPIRIVGDKKHELIDLRPGEIKAAQDGPDSTYKAETRQAGGSSQGSADLSKTAGDKKTDKKQTSTSKQARTAASFCTVPQNVTFDQLGGIDDIERELTERVMWPILYPAQYSYLGVTFGTGVLLHAPTGSGKTTIVHALVNKIVKKTGLQVHFYCVNSTEIITSKTGETEDLLRDIFREAQVNAPSVIFLDNVEIISTRGENVSREMERRIVSQLCSCMDEIASLTRPVVEPALKQTSHIEKTENEENQDAVHSTLLLNAVPHTSSATKDTKKKKAASSSDKENRPLDSKKYNIVAQSSDNANKVVMVIGATSKINAIDESLRRAGRFDKDIPIPIPSKEQRMDIIRKILIGCKVVDDLNIQAIAESTPGYVSADLAALCREAGHICMRRILAKSNIVDEMLHRSITLDDFKAATNTLIPTALREGFATVPDVSLDDIGALDFLKQELDRYLLQPLQNPERFARLGLNRFSGIIMFSVPGQGKTLICKALSARAEINFISVKGPELLNMYYGESERAIRNVFARARASAPCILFLDEFDSLAKRRGSGGSTSDVGDKVVNTLLTELDGLHNNLSGDYALNSSNAQNQIFIIAATNRIDMIDPGLLRPGRFDKLIYIPLPSMEDRISILYTIITRKRVALEQGLSNPASLTEFITESLAKKTDGYTGADLEGLVKRAAMAVIAESPTGTEICKRHFITALSQSKPSVSKEDRARYELMATHFVKNVIGGDK